MLKNIYVQIEPPTSSHRRTTAFFLGQNRIKIKIMFQIHFKNCNIFKIAIIVFYPENIYFSYG